MSLIRFAFDIVNRVGWLVVRPVSVALCDRACVCGFRRQPADGFVSGRSSVKQEDRCSPGFQVEIGKGVMGATQLGLLLNCVVVCIHMVLVKVQAV